LPSKLRQCTPIAGKKATKKQKKSEKQKVSKPKMNKRLLKTFSKEEESKLESLLVLPMHTT